MKQLILTTLILCLLTVSAEKVYVIAHMTNLLETAQWALKQGANALEMDVNFSQKDLYLHHGTPCDCTCLPFSASDNICNLNYPVCKGKSDLKKMFSYLSKNPENLSLVYIDSKVDTNKDLVQNGQRISNAILYDLFEKGYNGIVVVGSTSSTYTTYLKTVINRISKTQYKDRVFYSFDEMGKESISSIVPLTKNRFYSVGQSACSAKEFYDDIYFGSKNYAAGVLSFGPVIWTLSKPESMREYLRWGARGILVNRVKTAVDVVKSEGYSLVSKYEKSVFVPARSDSVVRVVPKWVGTAPFCGGSCSDCKGDTPVCVEVAKNAGVAKREKVIFGKECWSGKKVLCVPRGSNFEKSSGDRNENTLTNDNDEEEEDQEEDHDHDHEDEDEDEDEQ